MTFHIVLCSKLDVGNLLSPVFRTLNAMSFKLLKVILLTKSDSREAVL